MSICYHPTEFVTTEFWDAVNFAHGANPERTAWRRPRRRTETESERCYGILHWPIHPEGFSAPELSEFGKLQGWTLKPAGLPPHAQAAWPFRGAAGTEHSARCADREC
jgi:hypothetical protein